MKGFQPIAEEEEDSSNHKESWKDSGKNASKMMDSGIEIPSKKSKDNEYQELSPLIVSQQEIMAQLVKH